ncbi:MAG: hypothetical protein U0228_01750 [Myxococcaceae bacterium]
MRKFSEIFRESKERLLKFWVPLLAVTGGISGAVKFASDSVAPKVAEHISAAAMVLVGTSSAALSFAVLWGFRAWNVAPRSKLYGDSMTMRVDIEPSGRARYSVLYRNIQTTRDKLRLPFSITFPKPKDPTKTRLTSIRLRDQDQAPTTAELAANERLNYEATLPFETTHCKLFSADYVVDHAFADTVTGLQAIWKDLKAEEYSGDEITLVANAHWRVATIQVAWPGANVGEVVAQRKRGPHEEFEAVPLEKVEGLWEASFEDFQFGEEGRIHWALK